jgi:hypothetical protein
VGGGGGRGRRSSTAPGNAGTAAGEREREGNAPPWGRRCTVAGVEEIAPVEWRGSGWGRRGEGQLGFGHGWWQDDLWPLDGIRRPVELRTSF